VMGDQLNAWLLFNAASPGCPDAEIVTRRSDGIPLPILFDACDVRAASNTNDRKNAASSRSSVSESRRTS